jgi:hypothetical protein
VSAGTFVAFSKIHLHTKNSIFRKVVDLVEEHNFHVDWHFKFGEEKLENPLARQKTLFAKTG